MNSGHVRQHTQSVRLRSFKPNEEMIKKKAGDSFGRDGILAAINEHAYDC